MIKGGVIVVTGTLLAIIAKGQNVVNRHIRDWVDAFAMSVLSPAVLPRQMMLSLGTTFLNLLAFALCAGATGTIMPVLAVMIVVPLILFTMLSAHLCQLLRTSVHPSNTAGGDRT